MNPTTSTITDPERLATLAAGEGRIVFRGPTTGDTVKTVHTVGAADPLAVGLPRGSSVSRTAVELPLGVEGDKKVRALRVWSPV